MGLAGWYGFILRFIALRNHPVPVLMCSHFTLPPKFLQAVSLILHNIAQTIA